MRQNPTKTQPTASDEPEGREVGQPEISTPDSNPATEIPPPTAGQSAPVQQMESVQDVRYRSSDEDFGVKL
ncbi:hypothetical protein [Erwinia endophytica]|uniref:hypothetical protein n=1 Tax=Erwinia endophytica TaxID=1563158 RepID=UPI00186B7275|nr:hypothetical protein [Erwinia endophytica]